MYNHVHFSCNYDVLLYEWVVYIDEHIAFILYETFSEKHVCIILFLLYLTVYITYMDVNNVLLYCLFIWDI